MRTASVVPWLPALAVAAWTSFPGPAVASHHVFSSSVDRFEIDGNVFGSPDGALDFVDEFDDGFVGPEWEPLLGTAVEAAGVMTLRNPGGDVSIGGLSVDVSNIEHEDALHDGGGDFTATSHWIPVLPDVDLEFHFQTYAFGGVIEAAGLTVTNYSAATAAGVPGLLAGPAVNFQLARFQGGTFDTIQSSSVAIDPQAISGNIALRLSFDDATNMLTGSFSLDGGATYQSPFPSAPIFVGVSTTELLLGAGSNVSTPPPPPPPPPPVDGESRPMTNFDVQQRSDGASRKVVVETGGGRIVGNPAVDGAFFNVALDGTAQCFALPANGWFRKDFNHYRYRDPLGMHGAVKSADLSYSSRAVGGSGAGKLKIVILGKFHPVDIAPPNPGNRGDVFFNVVNGTRTCSGTSRGTVLINDARRFRVRGGGGCALTSCGP
jgi:hypothetical protein